MDRYQPDYTQVYTPQELTAIEDRIRQKQEQQESFADNEDFGRYIGYEAGASNHVKLPWTLMLQTNQPGQYTDITYMYLVFFLAAVIFAGYRSGWRPWILSVFGVLFVVSMLFSVPGNLSIF